MIVKDLNKWQHDRVVTNISLCGGNACSVTRTDNLMVALQTTII